MNKSVVKMVNAMMGSFATLTENNREYLVYTATFGTVNQALEIAEWIERDYGIIVAIRS